MGDATVRRMKKRNKGSSFDSWLRAEGSYEEVSANAIKRVLTRQVEAAARSAWSWGSRRHRLRTKCPQSELIVASPCPGRPIGTRPLHPLGNHFKLLDIFTLN